MTLRIALFTASMLAFSGAAQSQILQPTVDRVVVHTQGKSMRTVRAELWRASETVCHTDEVFDSEIASDCVASTYGKALREAKRAASTRPTTVASR